jgi:hypothetical protein
MAQNITTIAGMAWYRPEDYAAILSIMEDPHTFFNTYEEWLSSAEKGEKSMRLQGRIVVRAYIDPATFPAWCRGNGHNVDAKARAAYAKFIAGQQAGNAAH